MAAVLLLASVSCGGEAAAPGAGLEGFYQGSGKEPPTIQFVREEKSGQLAGILVEAQDDWHRKQLQQAVLELKPVGDKEYRGRCSAYHVRFSKDMAAWLEVTKAELLDSGDLRCRLKIPDDGTVEILFRRVQPKASGTSGEGQPSSKPGEAAPAEPDEGDLTGLWRTSTGGVTRYERTGDRYTGFVVKIAPESEGFGFQIGEETVRLTRKTRNAYLGTIKVNTEGGKQTWWEDIEMTAEKNALSYVRHKANGQEEKGSGVRVRTLDGK
jgi:hypothetical protein